MSDPIKVKVTAGDMSVEAPDKTIISSTGLVNALVIEPADAWQSIATSFGKIVSTDSLRVSEDGRITIRDRDVFQKAKEIIESGSGASSNFICGNLFCGEEK